MERRNRAMQTTDTAEIKKKIDLRDLAGRVVELRREKSNGSEMSGPCPKCHGTDRFHCTAEWFFCRQCHDDRGDAIDLVQFLGLANDFRAACNYLSGWTPSTPNGVDLKYQPERKAGSTSWKAPTWQRTAREFLDTATLRLDLPEGEPGRAYLAGRGILPATWAAWSLGYAEAWHPKRSKRLPAVILPWRRGETIKALQYRFIGEDISHDERFGQKGGGDRTIFGAQHLVDESPGPALVIVEGELNAVSVWQEAHDLVDVLSFGPESNIDKAAAYLLRQAGRYDRVIVWADKPDAARSADRVLAGADLVLQSPGGLDANDLLQRGLLRDFLAEVLGRLPDPRFDDVLAERRFQRLVASGRQQLVLEVGSFVALETRCGELHAQLIDFPRDSELLALYDGYAAVWESCRGLTAR